MQSRSLSHIVVILFSFSVFSFAYAQDSGPSGSVQQAIEELAQRTGQTVTTPAQAHSVCDQEKYLDICTDVGKKYQLYTPDETKKVNAVLEQLKGSTIAKLKQCTTSECLVQVADDISKNLSVAHRDVAQSLSLTPDAVQQHKGDIDKVAQLRDALAQKTIQCGDGTIEGCGQFCLQPSSDRQGQGIASIPPVCSKIAEQYFGPQGVQRLRSAYRDVQAKAQSVTDDKLILTTPDGSHFIGQDNIRSTCDKAFSDNNVDIAKACGDFGVNNGLVTREAVDRSLHVLEGVVGHGQEGQSFDSCLSDPEACKDLLPEKEKQQFNAGQQIQGVLQQSLGSDITNCRDSQNNPAVSGQCLAAFKRALPQLQNLAQQSPEAQKIINSFQENVRRQESFAEQGSALQQQLQQVNISCSNPEECRSVCSDPANAAKCFDAGSKLGIVNQTEGQQKLEQYQNIFKQNQDRAFERTFDNRGRFPGGQNQQFKAPEQRQQPFMPQTPRDNSQNQKSQSEQFPQFPSQFPGQQQSPATNNNQVQQFPGQPPLRQGDDAQRQPQFFKNFQQDFGRGPDNSGQGFQQQPPGNFQQGNFQQPGQQFMPPSGGMGGVGTGQSGHEPMQQFQPPNTQPSGPSGSSGPGGGSFAQPPAGGGGGQPLSAGSSAPSGPSAGQSAPPPPPQSKPQPTLSGFLGQFLQSFFDFVSH